MVLSGFLIPSGLKQFCDRTMRTRSTTQRLPNDENEEDLSELQQEWPPKKKRLQSLSVRKPVGRTTSKKISQLINEAPGLNGNHCEGKVKVGNKPKHKYLHQQKSTQPRRKPRKPRSHVTMKKLQDICPPGSTPLKQDSKAVASSKIDAQGSIMINRAPVLTMWVAVVAQREGFKFSEGLSFGRAIAGILAQSKAKHLGIYDEPTDKVKGERKRKREGIDKFHVFGMNVAGKKMADGLCLAIQSGKPIEPATVESYLQKSFGSNYSRVKAAMEGLANSYSPRELGKVASSLYEIFRPTVPAGIKGWGAKGVLDIQFMLSLRK